MRTHWLVALGLGVALACSACATGTDGDGATRGSPTPSITEDLTVSPTTGAGTSPGTVELEGVVSAGVEAGCLILTTDTGAYTLIGRTTGIREGDRARVRGAEAPDVATVCQQGTVFRVDAVL